MTPVNSIKELALSGEKLLKGARDRIAEKHGVSPQYVTMVKNGTRYNIEILEDVILAIEDARLKRSELKARIEMIQR